MNPIDKLIFDKLAAGQGINLPDIGALFVERDPAKFISRSEIRPPQNRVFFSGKRGNDFESVIDLIMAADNVKRPEATKTYKEWLKQAKEGKGLIELPKVGVLKNDFFYPSALLHDALNPAGEEPVVLKSKGGRSKAWLIIILSLLSAAVITLFVLLALNGTICIKSCPVTTEQTESNVDTDDATDVNTTAAVITADAGKSAEDAIQAGLEQYAQSASTAAATTDKAPAEITYHVVAGVFSNEANADKLIANDELMIGSSSYVKMPYKDNMTMVTVFSSKSKVAAYNRHIQLFCLNPDLWVYEQK